jgi:two-component system cell cycle response regulator DivK
VRCHLATRAVCSTLGHTARTIIAACKPVLFGTATPHSSIVESRFNGIARELPYIFSDSKIFQSVDLSNRSPITSRSKPVNLAWNTMRAKILIVEDNEINHDMLSRYLQLYGYDTVQASDGATGIEVARQTLPNLVLMDVNLPEVDGWEITRQLKQDAATADIPVIALTAHAMLGDREKSLAAGCDEYESKPIDFTRLIGKIESLIKEVVA